MVCWRLYYCELRGVFWRFEFNESLSRLKLPSVIDYAGVAGALVWQPPSVGDFRLFVLELIDSERILKRPYTPYTLTKFTLHLLHKTLALFAAAAACKSSASFWQKRSQRKPRNGKALASTSIWPGPCQRHCTFTLPYQILALLPSSTETSRLSFACYEIQKNTHYRLSSAPAMAAKPEAQAISRNTAVHLQTHARQQKPPRELWQRHAAHALATCLWLQNTWPAFLRRSPAYMAVPRWN
ncbi:hypothetical protein TNCT_480431 [Trichonephila clavata]|uniref:Uncharacterized protein n=1 Tax=Trichonephila clavata TaxID=2740835 RepID=A0A8X6GLE8_TRICU|nr:hypothetical protein TNCT_480431 [Trichonephila clavata]